MEQGALMDWDWLPIAIMLVLVGGFYFWSLRLAFQHGVEMGKQLDRRAPVKTSLTQSIAKAISPRAPADCQECGHIPHHPDCPADKPKPARPARQYVGFSKIKRDLENA